MSKSKNTNNIKRFSRYKDGGLSGLANLGNTCFINSCVQVLSHTYELNQLLDSLIQSSNEGLDTELEKKQGCKFVYSSKIKNKKESIFLLEWDRLRRLLWTDNCVISPKKFIHTVQQIAEEKGNDIFTGYAQNDIGEFLLFMMECFHNTLSRNVNMSIEGNVSTSKDKMAVVCFEMIQNMYSKDYSEIWKMFYGIHVSQIISSISGEVLSFTPEPFFITHLPIPPNNKSPSLMDCFTHYSEGEEVEYRNEKTECIEPVRRSITFWSFPDIVVIILKRANPTNFRNKNQILVDFPLEGLDLSSYVVGYNKESYIYDVYGICNHSGGNMGGHYTSFVKNANGKWYHFNDTHVDGVNDLTQLVTSKAYCLFYRKRQ